MVNGTEFPGTFTRTVFDKIRSSDYVNVIIPDASTGVATYSCVNYHSDGRDLLKELQGLGYQLSMKDFTSVSLLPLLAYYKAKFDRFYPTRLNDWETSWTYRFIRKWEDNPQSKDIDLSAGIGTQTSFTYAFLQVLYEIRDLLPTHEIGWREAHISNIANGQPLVDTQVGTTVGDLQLMKVVDIPSPSVVETTQSTNGNIQQVMTNMPAAISPITKWSIDLLRRMTQYVVKDSIIGNRLQLWLKSHLDSDVYNIVYQLSNNIAGNELQIEIGDINSTADTVNNGGDYLGSYAGKGIGSGKPLSFTYKANTYGFLFVLTWLEVETDYFQGTSTQLFMKGRYTVPQQEFDALGYECTPYSAIYTDNGFNIPSTVKSEDGNEALTPDNNIGFGFMPRYSGWKHLRNIVNGDFALGRYKDSMNQMYIDKTVTANDLTFKADSSGNTGTITATRQNIPVASAAWQYNSKYPWLSNFNRIFYNSGDTSFAGLLGGQNIPDNFYIHAVIDVEETNTLKPLANSYDSVQDTNEVMTSNMS